MTARTDHLDPTSFATRAMPSVNGLDRVTAVLASEARLVDDQYQGNRHCKKLSSARSRDALYGRGVAKLRSGDGGRRGRHRGRQGDQGRHRDGLCGQRVEVRQSRIFKSR